MCTDTYVCEIWYVDRLWLDLQILDKILFLIRYYNIFRRAKILVLFMTDKFNKKQNLLQRINNKFFKEV